SQSHGLFDKHVLSGAKGSQGGRGMEERRQANIDELDAFIRKEGVQGRVHLDSAQIHRGPALPEIPPNILEVAACLFWVAGHDSHDFAPLEGTAREKVSRSHEAHANNANSNGRTNFHEHSF